jgi:hypothetical protein
MVGDPLAKEAVVGHASAFDDEVHLCRLHAGSRRIDEVFGDATTCILWSKRPDVVLSVD